MAHRLVVHLKRSPYDVRIDRASKWGNPFLIGRDGTREQVIDCYDRWLPEQPALMAALHELRGATLGCWCAPRACHGDVLARRANIPLLSGGACGTLGIVPVTSHRVRKPSMSTAIATPSITCGHCGQTHHAVEIVRACYQGASLAPCDWLVREYFEGEPYTQECGAEAAYTADGFWCTHGHEHTSDEARRRAGWDYAEDAYDAAVVAAGGRVYRPMTAGTHIDPAEVAQVMRQLF